MATAGPGSGQPWPPRHRCGTTVVSPIAIQAASQPSTFHAQPAKRLGWNVTELHPRSAVGLVYLVRVLCTTVEVPA